MKGKQIVKLDDITLCNMLEYPIHHMKMGVALGIPSFNMLVAVAWELEHVIRGSPWDIGVGRLGYLLLWAGGRYLLWFLFITHKSFAFY